MASRHRKGFTLIEVLMSVMIMSIMAGVMAISFHSADQNPKREAEKVAAYITRLTQKSDRIKMSFDVKISNNALIVSWGNTDDNQEPSFDISAGLECTLPETLTYDYKKYPKGAKIFVSPDTNGIKYNYNYIKIAKIADNSSSYYVIITSTDCATTL